MKIYKYIIVLLFALNTTSCNMFLDIMPTGEVVNNQLFKNAEGFEDAIYGVYSILGTSELYAANLGFYLSDVAAQYLYPSWSGSDIRNICVYDYKNQKLRPMIDEIWNKMYFNISSINNVIENLELKDPKSMRYYDIYKGESLALRAFMHFELTRYFCDNIIKNPKAIGIPYRESYTLNVNKFEPLAVTYEKIIRDLKLAEELLLESESLFYTSGENPSGFVKAPVIHMNLDAVRAVLARVYWTKNELEKAANYAKKVIDSKRYACVDDTKIEDLMNGVLSLEETIFGIYSRDEFYNRTTRSLYYSGGGEGYNVKEDYTSWYDEDRDGYDARYDKWFKNLSDFGATGLRFLKIVDMYSIKQLTPPGERLRGINMIRIPEMYYIVSEYYLYMEDYTNAHRYFDAVISKRGLKPYSQRGEFKLTVKNLNVERRKELVGEGQYFHVMKRYSMDATDITTDRTFKATDGIYIFPIPQSELDSNPIN